MQHQQALDILELPHDADENAISHQIEKRRADLEKRVANAPTMPLKAKYRAELARLESAVSVLEAPPAEEDEATSDLPTSQKLENDDEIPGPSSAKSGAARPSPGGGVSGRKPPTRAETSSPSARKPPTRATSPPEQAAHGEPSPRGKKAPSQTDVSADDEYAGDDVSHRESFSKRGILLATGIFLALLLGSGYAGWRWWYQPKIVRANLAEAVNQLGPAGSGASQIQETTPRIRTLAWVSTAFAFAGEKAPANHLLTEASNSLSGLDAGSIREELECRICVAQAASGDPNGALNRLSAVKANRLKSSPPQPVSTQHQTFQSSAPVTSHVPVREDEARRGIAIAQARQGDINGARVTIDGIMDEQRACEALAEVAKAASAVNKESAATFFQSMEDRAKRIADPVEKSELLCLVADRIIALGGKKEANVKFAKEALGLAASGSSAGSSRPTARSVISQARTLRSMWKMKDKETFKKRIVEITGLASNLFAVSGGQQVPDHVGRAQVHMAVALAWNDAGDDVQADKAVGEALSAASLAADLQKQRALSSIVAGLAEMKRFEQAAQVFSQLSSPDDMAVAGETLAYWHGWERQIEQGTDVVRRLPEGESRCRATVAFQYGLRQAELERWW